MQNNTHRFSVLLVIHSTNMELEDTDAEVAAVGLVWTVIEEKKTNCQSEICQSNDRSTTYGTLHASQQNL